MAGPFILTSIDEKILARLEKNGRESLSKIAQAIHEQKDTVQYRYNRMQPLIAKIIPLHTIITTEAQTLLLIIRTETPLETNEKITLESVFSDIHYCSSFFSLRTTVKKTEEIDIIIQRVKEIIQRAKPKISFHLVSGDEHYTHSYLHGSHQQVHISRTKINTCDERLLKLLQLLEANVRAPVNVLAEKLNLSSSAVVQRITALNEKGIIKGYKLILRPKLLRKKNFIVLLPTHEEEKIEQFRKQPSVIHIQKLNGEYAYFIEMIQEDLYDAKRLLQKLLDTDEYELHETF